MDLSELFCTFKKSAKRLELLQEYHIEGQEWNHFCDYKSGKILQPFNDLIEWNKQIKEWTTSGKTIERL